MKNLGLKNNTKDIANLEDIKTPSNMVTTDSAQTISGAKTFTKTTTFQNEIKANGSAGTLGQVLTSQGSGNSPQWKDIPTPSNMVTTNTDQIITGPKLFSNDVVIGVPVNGNGFYVAQNKKADGDWYFQVNADGVSIDPDRNGIPLLVNREAGSPGQVLMSQGLGYSPKWGNVPAPSNVVTTDTAQTIAGTKTFSNIQITGDTTYQDARLNFENANGAQQTLLTDDSLSSSVSTSFTLPSVIDSSNTYELGTALYNHCVIVSGTNCYAAFNVLCNRSNAFTSIEDICNTVIAPQDGSSSLVFHIAASGRVYASSLSAIKLVDYVELTSGFIRIHYLSLSSSASGRLNASFVDDTVLSCNLTHK